MTRQQTLRTLLTANLALLALYIALFASGEFDMQGVYQTAADEAQSNFSTAQGVYACIVALLWIVGMALVWFETRGARPLYTLAVGLSLLCVGPSVVHPVEGLLESVGMMLDGAILAVLWFGRAAHAARHADAFIPSVLPSQHAGR